MIQPKRFAVHPVMCGLFAGALVLSACTERETYLVGERENVRSVLTDPDLAEPLQVRDTSPNESRPIALGAASNNASWSQSAGTPKYRTTHPALRAASQLAWSADIGQGDSRKLRISADPVVAGGRVFTLDASATVTATSTSGTTLWSRDLTPTTDKQDKATGGGLAVEGDTIYASIGYGVMAAIDAATGTVRWTQDLDATGTGTPTVYGDLVYLTAGDNTGWALKKSDGRIQWQTDGTRSASNVLGTPAPAINDNLAIFAFGSGEVAATFRQGGLTRWNTSVVGKRPGRAMSSINDVTTAPILSGDTLYAGNQSGRSDGA